MFFPKDHRTVISCLVSKRIGMQRAVEKLTSKPLSVDQLIEYVSALEKCPVRNLVVGRKARQFGTRKYEEDESMELAES
jgi:hypothetical protein